MVRVTRRLATACSIWLLLSAGFAQASRLSEQALEKLEFWNEHPARFCHALTTDLVQDLYGKPSDSVADARARCARAARKTKAEPYEVLKVRERSKRRVVVTLGADGVTAVYGLQLRKHWRVIDLRCCGSTAWQPLRR